MLLPLLYLWHKKVKCQTKKKKLLSLTFTITLPSFSLFNLTSIQQLRAWPLSSSWAWFLPGHHIQLRFFFFSINLFAGLLSSPGTCRVVFSRVSAGAYFPLYSLFGHFYLSKASVTILTLFSFSSSYLFGCLISPPPPPSFPEITACMPWAWSFPLLPSICFNVTLSS